MIVTNGSMQADAFLFDALVEPGDAVIVERPTYDRTLLSLRNRGADVRMVELEPDGIDVAALERVLVAGAKPKLAHIIPNFQNPAGYTLSADKRERLLELARAHEFTIFEDDPYVELRFEGAPLATMLSLDPEQRRLRVVVLEDRVPRDPCRLPRRAGRADRADHEDRHDAPTSRRTWSPRRSSTSSAAPARSRRSIETGQGGAARARPDAVPRRCAASFPTPASSPPEGGYFMWVELPRGTDVSALFTAAAERGVQFVKGSDFVLDGGESSLRLAYSGVTPEPRSRKASSRSPRRTAR